MPEPRVIVDPFTGKRRMRRTVGDVIRSEFSYDHRADMPLTEALDCTQRTARAILHQRRTIKGRRIA